MDADVVVVGAGIAGLTCASKLREAGREVLVLEQSSNPGGNIQTQQVEGFRLERGPHSFLASAEDVFALSLGAGLEDELLPSRPAAARRFVVRNGKLHDVPTAPLSFLTTQLLSVRSKLELMTEPLRVRRGDPDDSAAQFFARRFGTEAGRILAGAFISGVYAGDPDALSARDAFPLFWGFEESSGSMIRGALRYKLERALAPAPFPRSATEWLGAVSTLRKKRGQPGRSGLYSFRAGLGQLTGALARSLDGSLRTNTAVRSVGGETGAFQIELDSETLIAPNVVVATPPNCAASILRGIGPEVAPLESIPMAPMVGCHLGFSHALKIPDAFGCLIPRGEGFRTLGVLCPSRIFAGRVPESGGELLTAFVGGMLDPAALDLTDDDILETVRREVAEIFGVDETPIMTHIARYPTAIPQLTRGHRLRIESLEALSRRLPGLTFAGNYLRGVGIKDAVGSGLAAASALQRAETSRASL